MNNRDKIVNSYVTIIEEELLNWGYVKGTSEYDKQLGITKEWLTQFEPNEISLAIQILQNIQYYDEKRIRTIIHKLSQKLSAVLPDISKSLFFPLGSSSSSSGGLHLYHYRKELNLSEDNFRLDNFKKYLKSNIDIVFFDDIIGSGKQATSFFNDSLAGQQSSFYYIALMGFEDGIQYILNNANFKSVIVGQCFTSQDCAFSDDSIIFGEKKTEIKQLCQKYGDKLFPSHPLGYNNTQALIVLPHTVPNNTLPIIWAGDNNEGRRSSLLWTPLFQRNKPKSSNKKISAITISPQIELKERIVELYYNAGFDVCKIEDTFLIVNYVNNNYSHRIYVNLIFQQNDDAIQKYINSVLNEYQCETPSLIQFWFLSDASQVIRQLLCEFEKKLNINILIEKGTNSIDSYTHSIDSFRKYIINALSLLVENDLLDEYSARISKSNHFLVDRHTEQITLKSDCSSNFYIIGLSFCGKTQLLKNIIREYSNQQYFTFWHTIISNDNVIQYRTFLMSFGYFFKHIYADSRLNIYIQKYGCGISNELLSLISLLIKHYKPIIVIDDIHKCSSSNIDLLQILFLFIREVECRVYMAGWFNIFNNSANIQANIRYLTLNGLSYDYLDQIIQKNIGCSKIDIAKEIELRYSGLPGYAELVSQDTNLAKLCSTNLYFNSFIEHLTRDEQIVLFLLGYVSVPIRIVYFEGQNLLKSLYALAYKKLVREEGEFFSVHDTYRLFISSYAVDNEIFTSILLVAQSIIMQNYRAALDLINICLSKSKYYDAYNILTLGFDTIIHNQAYPELLKYLQQIENNVTESNWDVLYRKIILLERVNEYDLCISYILMINDELEKQDIKKYVHCLYVYFRCLYFTNQYDNIIRGYLDNAEIIFKVANRKILCQVFLLIGRVFYIRGDISTASIIYILAYQYAYGDKVLEAKTIYRIGMIEYANGLINESISTFSHLLNADINLTPKRRSYIYNKLARSYLAIENIVDCRNNNNESLKIKKIYHDERGLIFCKKLQAETLLYENRIPEAVTLLDEAKELSIKLSLDKEAVSINLVLIHIYLKYSIIPVDDIVPILKECIHICKEEKLLSELKIIANIYEVYHPNLQYHNISVLYNNIRKSIQNDSDEILNLCGNKLSSLSLQWIELFKCGHCISSHMLQLSGLMNERK